MNLPITADATAKGASLRTCNKDNSNNNSRYVQDTAGSVQNLLAYIHSPEVWQQQQMCTPECNAYVVSALLNAVTQAGNCI